MTPDYDRAALMAAETLIKYGVSTAPVSPLAILEKIDNVIIVTFSELCHAAAEIPCNGMPLFGRSNSAMTSVHNENGKAWYVVAYNSLLPYSIVQHALARELGHIVLGHNGANETNDAEAVCFAQHLLCPRALIHSVAATNLRITMDVLANLTGVFHECLACMRHTPGTAVPASVNRFVRGQFMPFIMNFFEYYTTVRPGDGSAIADFGTFMDGYEE